MKQNIKIICLRKHNWFVRLFSKQKRKEHKRWEERWGKHLTEAQEIEIIPMKYEPHEPFYLDYTYKNTKNNMSESIHMNTENNMSGWITDRKPTLNDCLKSYAVVYGAHGGLVWYATIEDGVPWKPVPECEPYVKPKKYSVRETYPGSGKFAVYQTKDGLTCSSYLPTREAAERIAAIYEEVIL